MDNPFTPGNGVEPVFLAGRSKQIAEFIKSLKAVEGGFPRNTVVYGLRGTGKTVLLRHYKLLAESSGWIVLGREFMERYSQENAFGETFGKDIAELASEASIKTKLAQTGKRVVDLLKPQELSAYGIHYKPYYGERRDVLEDYLAKVLESNWPALKNAGKKGVVFLYDEFHEIQDKKDENQYVLSSLLGAFSKMQRDKLPCYLCLCGLTTLKTNLKKAKTYTERMFTFQETTNLEEKEAERAITEPLKKTPYSFQDDLVKKIVEETKGYPYFIQFYGYYLVDNAEKKNISLKDFNLLKPRLLDALDKSFFEDRFNIASANERKILLAMAKSHEKDGAVPAREIAKRVKSTYQNIQQYLVRLNEKGIIYRPTRGYYAFSIPLFRNYLQRQA